MIKNCTLFSMKDIHMLSYRLIKCSLLFLKYTGAKLIQCQNVKCAKSPKIRTCHLMFLLLTIVYH